MNRNAAIGNTIISIKVDDDVSWVAGNTETMHYVHTDYLNSYTYITDEVGELPEVLSYDPCSVKLGFWESSEPKVLVELIPAEARGREGRRRNAYDWTDYNVAPTRFDRGYTGHVKQPFGLPSEANQLRMPIPRRNEFVKLLGQFGLINMNGRVYDPFLARFLSPDPQLQSPDYSQNYNRYSYAWNNPLKYTDPSGEFIHLLIGAAIGGVFNWIANGAQFNAAGLGHFGVGALAGGLGAGVGAGFGALASGAGHFSFMSAAALSAPGFGAGAAAGFGAGFTGGMVTGTGNSLIQGENIGNALSNGLNSALWGGTIGGLSGGISGGIRAARAGNDFWGGGEKKFLRYDFEHYPSTDRIQDGCFPMTLGELDPVNDAKYYENLIQDYFSNRGINATSMKNIYLQDFFEFANIDAEKIGFINGLISDIPSVNSGVFGYTSVWGESGHAMPVSRLVLWTNKAIKGVPKFKVVFNNFGERFVINNKNVHDYGFYFYNLIK